MASSETWPEPELVKATQEIVYTQKHKGSLAVHSNRTSRMGWAACLVHLCRSLHPDRQAMIVGSDTFCSALYNPSEFRRLMDLAEEIVGSAEHLRGGRIAAPSLVSEVSEVSGAEVLDWQHSLAIIHKQQEKYMAEEVWDGHLPHLPEEYRDHSYFKPESFHKQHLVYTLDEILTSFGMSGSSRSLEALFYTAASHESRALEVALGEGDLDRVGSLVGTSDACFSRCSVAPKMRIRPLATHPAEERDRQPRFRPLFNTLLVFPDADQLFSQSPGRMLKFINMVRREPTCQVHFGMSEFRLEQMALSTAALESLCLPQPQLYPLVEHAFSLQSDSWVKSTVVRSPAVMAGSTLDVGVEMSHPGVVGSTPAAVSGRLVLQLPPPLGAFDSPSDLFRQSSDRKLLISVAFPPPVLPGSMETEHLGDTKEEDNEGEEEDEVKNDDEGENAQDIEPAVQRYMSKGMLDLSERTVRCKLDLVAGSLSSNLYGKHLVVTHDDPECLVAVADAVNARIGRLGGHPSTPPGMEAWQVGSTPRPREGAARPFLCLISTEKDADDALGGGTPRRLFRECAAIVCTRRVFLKTGLPRELGIYHIYLLPETVNVSHIHRGPRFGGVDVLHVWDYTVPLSSPALMGSPVAVGGPFAPSPKDCRRKEDKGKKMPFVVIPTAEGLGQQLQYLGSAAETTTTAYAVLDSISQYEKSYFGPHFRKYAETGPSISGVLELLRKSTSESNHADRAVRMCEAWRRRSGVSDEQYVRVASALNAILGSDRFRVYDRMRQAQDCDDLLRQMSANSVILFNIKSELHGLESMLQTLRSSRHTGELFPHFRLPSVDVRSGSVHELLDPAGLHPGGSASPLQVAAIAGAKVKLLDRLRLQTMEAQVAAWRAFVACRGLQHQSKAELVVRPVVCPHAVALAHSRAVRFQGQASSHDPSDQIPLVFGVSRGGLGMLQGGALATIAGLGANFLSKAVAGAAGAAIVSNVYESYREHQQKKQKKREDSKKRRDSKKLSDKETALERLQVVPTRQRAAAPVLPSVNINTGRRRLDRAMDRWVREREGEAFTSDQSAAADYEGKVRALPFSFLLSERELSSLIAQNTTNATNRIQAIIKAKDMDIEETVKQIKNLNWIQKTWGSVKNKVFNKTSSAAQSQSLYSKLMSKLGLQMAEREVPQHLKDKRKRLQTDEESIQSDLDNVQMTLSKNIPSHMKRNLKTKESRLKRDLKNIRRQLDIVMGDIENISLTAGGISATSKSTVASIPASTASMLFGPVSVASLVPEMRIPETKTAKNVSVLLSHDRDGPVPVEIIRAWENGMVVVPPGTFAIEGSVAPSAVSSSRLRVLENVLEMELEKEMKKQHKAAVSRVCETLTEPETLFLSVLVKASFDCKEDMEHKIKMLGCSYTCHDVPVQDMITRSATSRTYEYGVSASEKYKSFLWKAANAGVRLSVLRGI